MSCVSVTGARVALQPGGRGHSFRSTPSSSRQVSRDWAALAIPSSALQRPVRRVHPIGLVRICHQAQLQGWGCSRDPSPAPQTLHLWQETDREQEIKAARETLSEVKRTGKTFNQAEAVERWTWDSGNEEGTFDPSPEEGEGADRGRGCGGGSRQRQQRRGI